MNTHDACRDLIYDHIRYRITMCTIVSSFRRVLLYIIADLNPSGHESSHPVRLLDIHTIQIIEFSCLAIPTFSTCPFLLCRRISYRTCTHRTTNASCPLTLPHASFCAYNTSCSILSCRWHGSTFTVSHMLTFTTPDMRILKRVGGAGAGGAKLSALSYSGRGTVLFFGERAVGKLR